MIVCAGNIENFSFATPIGIGLIESTINLTRLALFDKPDFLLFIGSAGSYGKYKPFDIIESSIASNIELSFLQNKSYTPLDNVLESYKDDVSRETSKKEKVIINSSNYISTDFELAKQYRKHNIELENMEFFSVLRVSQEFEIPVAGIFIVTNYCDKNAHNDFIKNHKDAKNLLSDYVINRYKERK
jgi:nucleoside phosphorylase